jgi:hypothetical protein
LQGHVLGHDFCIPTFAQMIAMAKDAFDRWWEWAEKPAGSTLTIPAHFREAIMQLSPEQRCDRTTVNEAVRLADPDARTVWS